MSYSTDNPDSLEVLLKKAYAVNTINKESLAHISSFREEQGSTTATKQPSVKKRRTQTNDNHQDTSLQPSLDSIINFWRYYGEDLKHEKIVFDDFIMIKFSTFDDLIRLVDEYNSLLEKYELTMKDVKESRLAVEVVLRNVEILQVAAGELHSLILDASLDHTSTPKECVDEKNKQGHTKSFTSIEALKCKLTLPNQMKINTSLDTFEEHSITSLDTFHANGKHYIVTGSHTDDLLWDLNKNKVVAKLPTHGDLILFLKDGVQMLACKGANLDKVEIWNLSNRTKVVTLWDEEFDNGDILKMAIYEKDDKLYLVAACEGGTIVFLDLESFEVIGTDHTVNSEVDLLYVFYRDGKPHMICCREILPNIFLQYEPIEVWDLEEREIQFSFDNKEETAFVSSIVMKHNDEEILIILGESGRIHMWNLQNEEHKGDLQVYDEFDCYTERSLEVLECGGKSYLACPGDEATVIIWDIQNKSKVATLSTEIQVTAMRVFMNEDKPCLLTGDDEGNIKLWMEEEANETVDSKT